MRHSITPTRGGWRPGSPSYSGRHSARRESHENRPRFGFGETLTAEKLGELRAAAAPFAGKPYDLTFEWSDSRIYCSELVWKMYQRALGIEIGSLEKLRSFHLDDPLVRAKMRERYGAKVPLDEPAIAPSAMFDSSLLETVAQN